jgi:hypothetical protein
MNVHVFQATRWYSHGHTYGILYFYVPIFWGLVHPHTLQKMFRGIVQLFRVNMIFLILKVPELVSLWRMYIDYGAKCHHPNISHKVGHVWCKILSFMNSRAFKISPIIQMTACWFFEGNTILKCKFVIVWSYIWSKTIIPTVKQSLCKWTSKIFNKAISCKELMVMSAIFTLLRSRRRKREKTK